MSVALWHSGGRLWKFHILKEGDDVLLPEDAMEFLLQVDKRVGGLGMPDVGLSCLHSQPKMVADHLHRLYWSETVQPDGLNSLL